MIIERRVYEVVPGKVREFVDLVEHEELGMLGPRISHIIGYYCTEVGAIDQVIGIWRFASFEERETCRREFRGHVNFPALAPRLLPLLRGQFCQIQMEVPLDQPAARCGAVRPPTTPRDTVHAPWRRDVLVEETITTVAPGKMPHYVDALAGAEPSARQHPGHAPIIGCFVSDIGQLNELTVLRRVADWPAARSRLDGEEIPGEMQAMMVSRTSRLLCPVPFFRM